MKQRIEVKCPCCDKRIYVDVQVNDADMIDTYDNMKRREAEEQKRKQEELRAKNPELYDKAMAECDKIMGMLTEDK